MNFLRVTYLLFLFHAEFHLLSSKNKKKKIKLKKKQEQLGSYFDGFTHQFVACMPYSHISKIMKVKCVTKCEYENEMV